MERKGGKRYENKNSEVRVAVCCSDKARDEGRTKLKFAGPVSSPSDGTRTKIPGF